MQQKVEILRSLPQLLFFFSDFPLTLTFSLCCTREDSASDLDSLESCPNTCSFVCRLPLPCSKLQFVSLETTCSAVP